MSMFKGDASLGTLATMREYARLRFEGFGAEVGLQAFEDFSDAALAKVQAQDREIRRLRHELERGPLTVRDERRARAELRPHSGMVDNVTPIRRPSKGDAA